MVDGLGVGDVGNVVLRDRQRLSKDGIIIVVFALDMYNKEILAGPDIVSRGFVYVKESDELMNEALEVVSETIDGCLSRGQTDWNRLKTIIRDELGDYIWKQTKRKPMILPIIQEV